MKTLKTMTALCIMSVFAIYEVNAQPAQKGEVTFPMCWEKGDYYYNCLPEAICGYVTYSWLDNGQILNENFGGEFIGTESGSKYVIEDHSSQKSFIDNGKFFKFEKTVIVHRNGKPIGKLVFLYHYSVNANGELTSDHGDKDGYFWDCF